MPTRTRFASSDAVGIKQVDDKLSLATFMPCDLGYFDEDSCRLEPIENPFAAKVLPGALQNHSPESLD